MQMDTGTQEDAAPRAEISPRITSALAGDHTYSGLLLLPEPADKRSEPVCMLPP